MLRQTLAFAIAPVLIGCIAALVAAGEKNEPSAASVTTYVIKVTGTT